MGDVVLITNKVGNIKLTVTMFCSVEYALASMIGDEDIDEYVIVDVDHDGHAKVNRKWHRFSQD